MRKLVLILLMVTMSAGCVNTPRQKETLASQVRAVPVWRDIDGFTGRDWALIIDAARTMQSMPHDQVAKELSDLLAEDSYSIIGQNENAARVFILLRVAFDLPEKADPRQGFVFRSWSSTTLPENGDGTINLAWPIKWNNGSPALGAACLGASGPPYKGSAEYEYMLKRFQYRNLESVGIVRRRS